MTDYKVVILSSPIGLREYRKNFNKQIEEGFHGRKAAYGNKQVNKMLKNSKSRLKLLAKKINIENKRKQAIADVEKIKFQESTEKTISENIKQINDWINKWVNYMPEKFEEINIVANEPLKALSLKNLDTLNPEFVKDHLTKFSSYKEKERYLKNLAKTLPIEGWEFYTSPEGCIEKLKNILNVFNEASKYENGYSKLINYFQTGYNILKQNE